jgi:hypothetical protein
MNSCQDGAGGNISYLESFASDNIKILEKQKDAQKGKPRAGWVSAGFLLAWHHI